MLEEVDADEHDLREALESRFGCRGIELQRIQSNCVSKAYRATMPDGRTFFTKLAKVDSNKTMSFLKSVPPNDILPVPIDAGIFELNGRYVSSYEWCELKPVAIECMNDAQFSSFWGAYKQLTSLLQSAPLMDARVNGDALMSRIRAYASRFPILSIMISRLLSLRVDDYTYPEGTREVIIHGDFHRGNFGFVGDTISSFCDFDLLARGSEIDDLAFLLVERARRNIGRSAFCRLVARMNQLVILSGRPIAEWRIAINIMRLRMADQLISRHPTRARTLINVFRRDHRICRLLSHLS